MPTGIVKFYNAKRGYGIIVPYDGGRDVFVHVRELERSGISSLDAGARVAFDLEQDRSGRTRAANVRVDVQI
jgi:cold shock protein